MSGDGLPSYSAIVDRFALFGSSTTCNTQVGSDGSVSCSCKSCCRWKSFVKGKDPSSGFVQYEVFTQEHVRGLADYLRDRATEYSCCKLKVLEVGAGNGRLHDHLSRFLVQSPRHVQLTASDNGSRGLNGRNVRKQDARKAILEVQPDIVISSWMPMGIDWTIYMRAMPSVREYILIGETDNGICGHPWLTWGFDDDSSSSEEFTNDAGSMQEVESEGEQLEARTPAYVRDGWLRKNLTALSTHQICRTDEPWSNIHHSCTVSFRSVAPDALRDNKRDLRIEQTCLKQESMFVEAVRFRGSLKLNYFPAFNIPFEMIVATVCLFGKQAGKLCVFASDFYPIWLSASCLADALFGYHCQSILVPQGCQASKSQIGKHECQNISSTKTRVCSLFCFLRSINLQKIIIGYI